MCIDPERPQGIIKIENDEFWEYKGIREGRWRGIDRRDCRDIIGFL